MPPVHEVKAPNRRLDSWKEIAGFFDRDERTVKRWEKERQLPVHRLPGGSRARVFAFTEELERWMHSLELPAADSAAIPENLDDSNRPAHGRQKLSSSTARGGKRRISHRAGARKRRLVSSWLRAAGCARGWIYCAESSASRGSAHARAMRPEARRTHALPPAMPRPQELYLQGRYYWDKRTPEDLNKAVDLLHPGHRSRSQLRQGLCGISRLLSTCCGSLRPCREPRRIRAHWPQPRRP